MIQHSDIDYKICDFCKKFTIHYEGTCIEHFYIQEYNDISYDEKGEIFQ